jgi:hypothetical protein
MVKVRAGAVCAASGETARRNTAAAMHALGRYLFNGCM